MLLVSVRMVGEVRLFISIPYKFALMNMSPNLLINLYDKINPNTDSRALTAKTTDVLVASIVETLFYALFLKIS